MMHHKNIYFSRVANGLPRFARLRNGKNANVQLSDIF
jgi:hypothetical protein